VETNARKKTSSLTSPEGEGMVVEKDRDHDSRRAASRAASFFSSEAIY
jgi:hypothetical protein